MPACPRCSAATAITRTEQTRQVARTKFVVLVPAHACKLCREAFIHGEVLERVDLTIASELAATGPCSAETMRFMRKALGYPATKLATLLDVAPETLSRWERDQRDVDLNAWLTVGSIVLESAGRSTKTIERLAAARKHSKRAKVVRLELVKRAAKRSASL
jgi:hypothetical protein